MFIALNSEERGIAVKLPGEIRIPPNGGPIETTFDNNPQVPVVAISLQLKGGPRAPLATPLDCGTKTVTAQFDVVVWADGDAQFDLDDRLSGRRAVARRRSWRA